MKKLALYDRDTEIFDLKIANKAAKEASGKLNKRWVEKRNKYEQEKSQQLKEHRREVKAWKKDLGDANRKIVKLEKKLKVAETNEVCSLPVTASNPPPPVAKTSNAVTNPTCDSCDKTFVGEDTVKDQISCKHDSVCVTRQPLPPPFPTITHLVNERSKYHEHMMSRAGVPGRYPGHEKCMDAYSKNYGCDECVWLKWHGELHGYPDIHPSDYKKHLDPSEWEKVRARI